MWLRLLYIVCSTLLMACADKLSDVVVPQAFLSIVVHSDSQLKAQQAGAYLPDGAEVGLFVCAEDGSDYEGKGYANVKYTASGIESEQQWSTDPAKPVGLTRTKGVCYAYYPWQGVGVSLETIPITNDGTDWMYTATPATNLSNQSPTAQLNLVHAMTIIRCVVKKGPYNGSGVVQTAGVQGAGLATGASLNLLDSELTALSGVGACIQKEAVGTLGAEPIVVDLWAVPTGVSGPLFFELKVDDRTYRLQTPEVNPAAGSVYTYSLTVEGEELALSAAEVSEWVGSDALRLGPGLDLSDYALDWEVAKATDGVYAITAEGKALLYEYATENDFVGVAFVVFGKAYQVAKQFAKGPDGSIRLYFDKDMNIEIPGLPYYAFVSAEIEYGYLPLPDGSYPADSKRRYISGNYKNWINPNNLSIALSDFSGKENTKKIVAAQTEEGIVRANTCSQALSDFCADSELNEGYQDWLIPGIGQLGYIYLNRIAIENLISRLGGDISSSSHMSSTTKDYKGVYRISFGTSGFIVSNPRSEAMVLRLIREIV